MMNFHFNRFITKISLRQILNVYQGHGAENSEIAPKQTLRYPRWAAETDPKETPIFENSRVA